jgi:hypothetical protein
MKINRATIAITVLLALVAWHPTVRADDMDGVMMHDGKMMMMKMGKPAGPMASDITMANGTKVTVDGLIIKKDGTQEKMHDREMIMMDGKIMQGGNATRMAPQ